LRHNARLYKGGGRQQQGQTHCTQHKSSAHEATTSNSEGPQQQASKGKAAKRQKLSKVLQQQKLPTVLQLVKAANGPLHPHPNSNRQTFNHLNLYRTNIAMGPLLTTTQRRSSSAV
jgi:hypothetical protein